MAVDRADKENLPPATAAVARPHGVAVRSCKLKRLGRARRRVPLRDITNLFVAESAVAEWQQALLQQPHDGSAAAAAAAAELAVKNGPAGGPVLKPGRYLQIIFGLEICFSASLADIHKTLAIFLLFYSDYRFDVSKLEPVVAKPHSPDNLAPARECKDVKIDRVYIDSCIVGKTEDFIAAAKVFLASGKKVKVPAFLVPTTQKVWTCGWTCIASAYQDLVAKHAPRYLKRLVVIRQLVLIVALVWVVLVIHVQE